MLFLVETLNGRGSPTM